MVIQFKGNIVYIAQHLLNVAELHTIEYVVRHSKQFSSPHVSLSKVVD
jgi:hypothetical protein